VFDFLIKFLKGGINIPLPLLPTPLTYLCDQNISFIQKEEIVNLVNKKAHSPRKNRPQKWGRLTNSFRTFLRSETLPPFEFV